MIEKPYAPSADNNKAPILTVLRRYLRDKQTLLEIGSGTGQHLSYFARAFPNVSFQPSDLGDKQAGIQAWVSEANNILKPLILDVSDKTQYPKRQFDIVFSANTAHIMSITEVESMFDVVGNVLREPGYFLLYGPFNTKGEFTSESNHQFHNYLQSKAPHMGIRDIGDLKTFAETHRLTFIKSHPMPKNNQILVFQKR